MEKAGADAILERDTGPIEPYLAALASEPDLPDHAIAICTLRVEEAAPALCAVLARAADGASLSEAEARQLLRGVFILGGARHAAAFPTFARLLRRPGDELGALLGEALEIGLPKILSGLFDGDADALLALTRDPACIEDVKLSAMEAAAFLAFDGRIPCARMRTFLVDFATAPAAKGDLIWVYWADAIARLGLRDLVPLAEAAFADGRITQAILRRRQFDKQLAEAEAAPADASRFEDACYIADTREALAWTRTGERRRDDEPGTVGPDAPIEVHLALLGSARRPPAVALRACVDRFAEAAPRLRALLARAASGLDLSETESLQLFRGLFVLAAARDRAACAPFLRFLRRPLDEVEQHLGDAITESLSRLLISLFDGDKESLLAFAADPRLDEYVRGAALNAATFLAWEGRIGRERMQRFLVDFHAMRLAEEGTFVWYSWMQAVAYLGLGDLVPRVEAAWKAQWIDHSHLDWNDFKMDLARARTAWDDVRRLGGLGYVDDIVMELAWTDHDEADAGLATDWEPRSPDTPVVNPFRNVGRNDPCPCGSGKKYKKCCLATG